MDLSAFLKQPPGLPAPSQSRPIRHPSEAMPNPGPDAPVFYGGLDPGMAMNPSGLMGMNPLMNNDSTSYVKDMLRIDDYLDYLYHQLRGDILKEDGQHDRHWEPNQFPPGSPGGPVATEEGIRIILSKVTPFLSKFASHAALTVEQAHGYAYEAASEVSYFCILEGEHYKIDRNKWTQIILLVDAVAYLNLTRTVNAWESKRIASMHKGMEFTGMGTPPEAIPDFVRRFPGGV